jgi:iron(III) transport system permease protein
VPGPSSGRAAPQETLSRILDRGAAPQPNLQRARARLAGTLGALRGHRGASLAGWVALWLALAALLVAPVAVFLVQALSPRLFDEGTAWFTFANVAAAFSGATLRGLFNSLWVSATTAVGSLVIAMALAWGVHRTNLLGRRAWPLLVWMLLLMPSFLVAEGWEYLLQPHGILSQFGVNAAPVYHVFFGPVGVVIIQTLSVMPYAYMVVSAALLTLGGEFEEAARVHGAGAVRAALVMLPILAPAILSALAIAFAEGMSDFGVASTLAASAHFPIATYVLYEAIDNNPANFGVAAVVGWMLVASAAIPIAVQARVLKGRTYAVFSGRTRTPARRTLHPTVQTLGTAAACALFLVGLGAPILGAVVGSMLKDFGSALSVRAFTLENYGLVFHGRTGLAAPLKLSSEMAAMTGVLAATLGLVVARVLTAKNAGAIARSVDLLLLGAVALPGIVLAAGYIFAYNLPLVVHMGVTLYGTTALLVMGYLAVALPSQARLMVGPVAQVQDSLLHAARVHGSSLLGAWRRAVLPVLSQVLLWAWLLTFAKTLLELPVSQLLYAPGAPPVSVAITNYLGNYHYGEGTAMTVMALGEQFLVIVTALALFRLLAPRGWQRIGGAPR